MRNKTAHLYLAINFAKCVMYTFIAVALLVMLFDFIEVIRVISKSEKLDFINIVGRVFCKNYNETSQLFPFIIFIATMIFLDSLRKKNEIVVFATLGISQGQIVGNLSIVATFLFFLHITVFLPINSYFISIYNNTSLNSTQDKIYLTESGIWLKQQNTAIFDVKSSTTYFKGNILINAEKMTREATQMFGVKMWVFNENYSFLYFLKSIEASIDSEGRWIMDSVSTIDHQTVESSIPKAAFYLSISPQKIINSLKTPEEINIWKIPDFIKTLVECGFNALRYEIYMYRNFTLFITFFIMILVGFQSGFSYLDRYYRKKNILLGIIGCFGVYFLSEIMTSLMMNQGFQTVFSILIPKILIFVGYILLLWLKHLSFRFKT